MKQTDSMENKVGFFDRASIVYNMFVSSSCNSSWRFEKSYPFPWSHWSHLYGFPIFDIHSFILSFWGR